MCFSMILSTIIGITQQTFKKGGLHYCTVSKAATLVPGDLEGLVRSCSKLWLSTHQTATAGGLWQYVNLKHLQRFPEKCLKNKALGIICFIHPKFISVVVGKRQNSRLSDLKKKKKIVCS